MPNYIINVKEKGAKKASKNIGGLSSKLGSLKMSAMGAAAGFLGAGALVVGMKKAADAAGVQEAAEKKLATALGHTSKELLKQASAFQQQSKHGDETIIEMMALASNMGIAENQLSETTQMAIGLSEALGVDMNMAMKAAAGAIQGDTNMLTRYIPELKTTTDQTEKFGLVQRAANKGFEQSKALTNTMVGAMNQAKMAIGDAGEALGDLIAPMVKAGAVATKDLSNKLEMAFDVFGKIDLKSTGMNILNDLGGLGQAMFDTLKIYWDLLPDLFMGAFRMIVPKAKIVLGQLLDGIQSLGGVLWQPISVGMQIVAGKVQNVFINMLNFLKEQFNNLADTWVGEKIGIKPMEMTDLVSTEGISMANTAIGEFFRSMGEDNIQNTDEFTAALNDIWTKYAEQTIVLDKEVKKNTGGVPVGGVTPEQLEDQGEKAQTLKGFWNDATEKQKKDIKDQAKEFGSSIQTMAKAFPGMEKAAKRAAQVQALVDAYASANAAYKAMAGIPVVGPGLGIAAAAAAVGAGLANVKMIEKAATGADFVTSGPQMLMVGDNPGGREQVSVTPLSSPNIDGPQGGSSVTVNVSGNVLSQDFVEGELAENIKEAIRRGTDFGIG